MSELRSEWLRQEARRVLRECGTRGDDARTGDGATDGNGVRCLTSTGVPSPPLARCRDGAVCWSTPAPLPVGSRPLHSRAMSEELLAAVLALPASQRAELAHRLLLSLEPDASPDVQQAWVDELVRRARDLEEGSVKAVSWPDAKADVLASLQQRRASRTSS